MCGIIGVVSNCGPPRLETHSFNAMRDTMQDRGPDGSGTLRERNYLLGHRRLAIRDLEHGRQPWITSDGRFALVYNGELYNDGELRDQLARHGVRLKTRCDTEVLAEAWAQWGVSCVSNLRGMFAFGVVDRGSGETWLVRDRAGIKPLYYARCGNEFVFASTLAAIRRHPEFRARPNEAAMAHYAMTLRSNLGAETLFEGVECVLPGSWVHYRAGRVVSHTYWDPEGGTADPNADFEAASHETRELLQETIEQHLVSDTPVGLMLSGGVDSSLLASLMGKSQQSPSMGVCGSGLHANGQLGDDVRFARRCARHFGLRFEPSQVNETDYRQCWLSLVESSASPLETPSDVIIYRVAQQMRKSCKVAIGGEGADEAFCGYGIQHWSGMDFQRSRLVGLMDPGIAQLAKKGLSEMYGRTEFDSLGDHYLACNSLIPWPVQRQLFRWGENKQPIGRKIVAHYDSLFAEAGHIPVLERYALVLLRTNLPSLLGRLDRATMAASLEARVPYADHRVLEHALKLPYRFKIDSRAEEDASWLTAAQLAARKLLRPKRILRRIASGLLPSELAKRPKASFPTPLAEWLAGDWQPWLEARLQSSPFAQWLLRSDQIPIIAKLPGPAAMWKWPVINLALWGDQQFC